MKLCGRSGHAIWQGKTSAALILSCCVGMAGIGAAPEHPVGAAGEVRILDQRNILRTGPGDSDLVAKRLQRLRQRRRP